MVANAAMLSKNDVVAYVGANAGKYGLDPAALLAVANHEGLGTTPGSTWILKNEQGFNFGPPSWYSLGAGSNVIKMQGNNAAYWSWTPAGLDYWMQTVANSGAAGKQGLAAITTIVQNFENPRSDLVGGEITNASRDYPQFQAQIASGLGNPIVTPPDTPGNITIPPITIPGLTQPGQLPIPTDPQTTTNPTSTTGGKFSLHLFDTPGGPINLTLPWDFSGILLFLAAILAIIIGALMWDKSRNVIVKGAEVGAMAA